MAKSHLKLVSPAIKKRTVAPKRRRNGDLRTREYLTEAEVERLTKAATGNRHGHRDATMVLVAYRHGLRVSELVDVRWDQVDFRTGHLHVRRVKQGTPSTHPILGDELRAVCTENSVRIDWEGNHVTSAHNDRAVMVLANVVRFAVEVEEPS
jgi:integrase